MIPNIQITYSIFFPLLFQSILYWSSRHVANKDEKCISSYHYFFLYRFMYSRESLLSQCFHCIIDFLPSYQPFLFYFIHKLIVQIKTVSVDHSVIILSFFSFSISVFSCRSFILFPVIEHYRLFIICAYVFRKKKYLK